MTFLKVRLHREKKEYVKKIKKDPKSKFIRISSRRPSTEKKKTKKNLFCVFMLTDFSLRYITQRKERLRERKIQMSISPYTSTIHKHHTVLPYSKICGSSS
jgi:hypothetical protein